MTADISQATQLVAEETKRFELALPKLLEEIPGKWVVFKDGSVHASFDSEQDAYTESLEKFGLHGGAVVAAVVERHPVPMTAGVLYGIAG